MKISKFKIILGVLVSAISVILFTNMLLAQPAQKDWIITGEEVIENETITLNGNLIVKNKGKLTLKNVTLIINNSYANQYGISAEPGSSIFIYNSALSPSDLKYKFSFEVENATFAMTDSKFSGGGYAPSVLKGSFGVSALTIKNCQNVIFENNQIEYINSGVIKLLNVTNSNIKNNNILTREKGNDPYPGGIFLYNSKNNTITDNFITGVHTGMVFFDDSSGNYVENNELSPGTAEHLGQGITLDSSNNNKFVNNKIYGPTGCTAFRILASNNNLIEKNSVKDLRFGAIISHSSGNILANNQFSKIYEQDAVLVYRSQKNFVINNDISSSIRGITLSNFADDNLIQANNISAIKQGISIYFSSDNNTITENKVSNSKKGIIVHESSKNTIYNNNFIENNQQGYDNKDNSWSFEEVGNYWSDYIDGASYPIFSNGADEYPLIKSKPIVLAIVPEQKLQAEPKYKIPHADITKEIKMENQEILLENSFTIKNGGKLILDNVILTVPKDITKPYRITVETGGSLYIYNSKIFASETGKSSIYISALDGSTLVLKNSELRHVDGGMRNPGPSGAAITILGADVIIENNIIADSRVGLSLGWIKCSGSIVNNTYSNVLFPIEGKLSDSNVKINGNIINDVDILPLSADQGFPIMTIILIAIAIVALLIAVGILLRKIRSKYFRI